MFSHHPGAPVPEKLENALARQEHEKAGELNLSLPEPEEEDDSVAELHALALTQEIVSEVDTTCLAEIMAEQKANGKYALQNPSAKLKGQLEEYRQHRTKVLNVHRVGGRVTDVTTGGMSHCKSCLRLDSRRQILMCAPCCDSLGM